MKKINLLFCCLSVRDFEPNYWSKVYIFTNFEEEQNCVIESWYFSYEERYIQVYIVNLKSEKVYVTVLFVFNIHVDLQNSGQ